MGIIPAAFGIDLRENHLILTMLKKSFGRIRVVGYAIHPLAPEGDKGEREAQVIGLINDFVSRHSIKRDNAHLLIPRQKAIARFIRLPVATRENLRKVLEYELSKYTPFKSDEVYFDYVLLKEEKEWLTLFAAFTKKSSIESSLSLLKKIGIRPASVQIPTVSALNLFFYNKKPDEDDVSVLLGLDTPFLEMNLLEGADWRESYHLPLPPEPWATEIVRTCERSGVKRGPNSALTYYLYGEGDGEKNRTVLKETAGVKEVCGPPLDSVVFDGDRTKLPLIYPSIGAPLIGLIKPKVDLNLLPVELRKKRREIRKPLLLALLLLFTIFGLSQGTGLYLNYRDELTSTTEEIKRQKPEVEAVERLQKQKEGLAKEVAELEKFRSEEASKIEMLKELTRLLPDTAWIWNLKYNGKEIDISGYADSASDLIPLLDKSPLFEKVEFLTPVTRERLMRPEGPQEKERFRIKAKLEARRPGL
jgi:general secretion pathway protein L